LRTYPRFEIKLPWRDGAGLLAMALVYAALCKVCLVYFPGHGGFSIFWPPAGLALAALLLGGKRYAMSVVLGGALANGSDPSFSIFSAVGLAAANALEALAGRWLMLHPGRFSGRLARARDFFALVVFGGLLGAGLGALLGGWVWQLAGAMSGSHFSDTVLRWWMGEALGIVVFTPLLLVWQKPPTVPLSGRRRGEAVLLFLLAVLLGQLVFSGWLDASAGAEVGHYGMFLIVAWIALRLGLHAVVAVLCLAAVQGVIGTYQGAGMFEGDKLLAQQLNCWFFLLLLSSVGLSLAAHFNAHALLVSELLLAKKRQDALLHAVPDLLFEIDLDGHYHRTYTQHPELLLAPPSVLQGTRVQEVLPGDAATVVMGALQQANLRGFDAGRQYQLQLPGGPAWFELSVSRMDYAHAMGGPHFIVLSRDITARKAAEQDLRVAAIAFESREGMLVAGADHAILRVNQAFTQITGYPAPEVVGRSARMLRCAQHGEDFYGAVWETVNATGQWQGETWIRCKDGALLAIWGTLTAVCDEQQRVTHYVRTLVDSTQRQRDEQRRLAREVQLREVLVREVHHRIKNNLQGVNGVLRQFAEQHPETASPINQAISQVQSIAAIHGLQGRSLAGELLLPELVRAVAAGVQGLWHIPITVSIGPEVANCGLAQAEAVPMALVLNELLSNAVKHGGCFGAVLLQLQRAGRHEAAVVHLRIVNGVGSDYPDAAGALPPIGTACGLELVAALLPPAGARLHQQVRGRQFFSELELEPPAVIWRKSENGVDSTAGATQQQGMGPINKEKLEA
jgi:PAS domain S-box-containing protein